MTTAPNPLDEAIRKTLEDLRSLMDDDAETVIESVVAKSLARVLGRSPEGSKPKGAGKAGAPSGRGPKPGGRQLKALMGAKGFDQMDDEAKDKARSMITKLGAEWNNLSKDEKFEKITAAVGAPPKGK